MLLFLNLTAFAVTVQQVYKHKKMVKTFLFLRKVYFSAQLSQTLNTV